MTMDADNIDKTVKVWITLLVMVAVFVVIYCVHSIFVGINCCRSDRHRDECPERADIPTLDPMVHISGAD